MQDRQTLSLNEAITHLLEECRMVLPGIQALFGFQLIAVFNSGFDSKLDNVERIIHLAAIGLVAVAVALIMAPAAYHRFTQPREVTREFLRIANRLLLYSMFPLMLGIGLDFYLIARIILHSRPLSLVLTAILLAVTCGLWFLLPWLRSRRSVP